MDALGWFVTAIAILLTGISKAGLGGALGGLAVIRTNVRSLYVAAI